MKWALVIYMLKNFGSVVAYHGELSNKRGIKLTLKVNSIEIIIDRLWYFTITMNN